MPRTHPVTNELMRKKNRKCMRKYHTLRESGNTHLEEIALLELEIMEQKQRGHAMITAFLKYFLKKSRKEKL